MSDRPVWDKDGHDWPNRDASRFLTAGGIDWHVQVAGSGPVLLLLHGTGAATHSWRDMMPLLAAQFTVIAPDLPGHGFTGRGPQTLPAMARAVDSLLAELALSPRAVVGHSAGAAVAIQMAIAGLVTPRAIVGLSPALLPFPGLAAKLFPTLAKMLFVNPFVPYIAAGIARSPGEVARFLPRSTGSAIDARGTDFYARLFARAGHIAGAIGMMANWDLAALKQCLPQLAVPMLVVHGSKDAAIPLSATDEIAALVPDVTLRILPGLGHLAHEEAPQQVADLISLFLAGHAQ